MSMKEPGQMAYEAWCKSDAGWSRWDKPDQPRWARVESAIRADEAAKVRAATIEEAAEVAERAPYKRGGLICGCSEGLSNWTATAIRALAEK
jgi:hypothetical protein